jgi:NAD(P)-dependent dehydrogenase (short-subunit alcohol dehydrogenase family)
MGLELCPIKTTHHTMSKKILITGASGAFGSLTALALAAKGHQVVGTMRSAAKKKDLADQLQHAGVHVVDMDATDEASVNAAVAKAIEKMAGLDVVFNNAGVGATGIQELYSAADLQRIFDVNVFGTQRLMRAVLPHLRAQGRGTILHTSSCIGRMTTPFYGVYCASKYALESLAEGYRYELAGFGIESCIIEPGGMPTAFLDGMLRPNDPERASGYGEMAQVPEAALKGYVEFLNTIPAQRPERVAEAVVALLDMPFGKKPFRTVVDESGLKQAVEGYNTQYRQLTEGIFTAFGWGDMLSLNAN